MNRFRNAVFDYAGLVVRLCLIFVLIRILEYAYFATIYPNDLGPALFFQRSLNYDLLLIMVWSIFLLPVQLLLSALKREVFGRTIFKIASLLLIVLNLILTNFFMIAHFLMPAFVLEFSFKDMTYVAGMELSVKNWLIWMIDGLVLLASIVLFLREMPKRLWPQKRGFRNAALAIYGLLIVVTLFNTKHLQKNQDHFDNKFQYFLGNSKVVQFVTNVYFGEQTKGMSEIKSDEELMKAVETYQSLRPGQHFVSKTFPFMHVNSDENVLGPFFNTSDRPPSIVIVVSESLSSTFSGRKTMYGSMTPFLDSLTEHSLYWENFVSNLDRSFGSWTNILGSLPYGQDQRGFINKVTMNGDEIHYTNHLNLIDILKLNQYKSHFFYGGWIGFDNMYHYMTYLNIDLMVDENMYGASYSRKKSDDNPSGFKVDYVWGYDDAQVYRRSFEDLDLIPEYQPMLNMYMTLSNHLPYVTADEKFYNRRFQDSILLKQGCDPEHLGNLSRPELACILFADDALRKLIKQYKKRDDFKNTIFIVVGDHGGGSLSITNRITPYRVPLLIYSELLKTPKRFKAVSSHIDILPSLLSLLKNNFNLETPYLNPFIGEGLDTSSTYKSRRMVPMNIFDSDRINFMLDDVILEQDRVYTFDENFNFSPCEEEGKIRRIKDAHLSYLKLNKYAISKQRIWDPNYVLGK